MCAYSIHLIAALNNKLKLINIVCMCSVVLVELVGTVFYQHCGRRDYTYFIILFFLKHVFSECNVRMMVTLQYRNLMRLRNMMHEYTVSSIWLFIMFDKDVRLTLMLHHAFAGNNFKILRWDFDCCWLIMCYSCVHARDAEEILIYFRVRHVIT